MSGSRRSTGVVLIVVLWAVAILAVVCLALGGTVRSKLAHLQRNRSELIGQEALLSAAALGRERLRADPPAADTLADDWCGAEPDRFTLSLDGVEVRVFSPPDRCGLEDESARLNGNTATAEMLGKLPGMTPSVAAAFAAARESARAAEHPEDLLAGATGVTEPYATPRQLADALVRAFAEAGLARPAQYDGGHGAGGWRAYQAGLPPDVAEVMDYLTVFTRQRNLDARGRPRVNVNTASRADLLAAVDGHFSDEQIEAILLARAAEAFESIGQLLTREMEIPDAEGETKVVRIGREQLKPVADRLTATDEEILAGLVNVNTAPREVLRALPGLTEADVAGIIAHRTDLGTGPFGPEHALASIGWLLDVLSEESFAEVCLFVTTRSQQFRMHAEARPLRSDPAPSAGSRLPGEFGPVARVSTYALAVLEREPNLPAAGGSCSVLFWLKWSQVSGAEKPGWR